MPGYLRLSLFGEAKSIVIRRSTPFLVTWVSKYTKAITPRRLVSQSQMDIGALEYCLPCEEEPGTWEDTRGHHNLCGTLGTDRGDREGSSDLFPD